MSDLTTRKSIKAGNLTATNLRNIEANFSHIWTQWETKVDTSPDGNNALIVDGKINTSYLPDYILGNVMYGGTILKTGIATVTETFKSKYDVLTKTVTVTAADASKYEGVFFIVTGGAADNTVLGVQKVTDGDWLISNGTAWDKVDNTDAVVSVNGQIGAVKTYKGEFAAGTTYNAGDIVLGSDGILYVAKADNSATAVTDTTAFVPAISVTLTDKLNGIQAGAQVNVIESVKVAGTALDISDKAVNIPYASGSTVGVVYNSKNNTTIDGFAESPISDGHVYYKDTTYETFTTTTAGLVPASGDGAADKYLSADGTFKTITIPAVPVYGLKTAADSAAGKITQTKDSVVTDTVTITGSGLATVSSDASGNITVAVDAASIPSEINLTDVQITSSGANWTTITLDGETYQAYKMDDGQKVFKVFAQSSVVIGGGTSTTQLVQIDAPIVSTGTIDYILVEEKMSMTARVIAYSTEEQ